LIEVEISVVEKISLSELPQDLEIREILEYQVLNYIIREMTAKSSIRIITGKKRSTGKKIIRVSLKSEIALIGLN